MGKESWFVKGLIFAFISAILAFFAQHYGEFIMNNIGNLIKSFLVTFSPLIIGALVFFVYWIMVGYVKMRRFDSKVEKWIGLFSYKDDKGSYSDLKGKIKRYIQEELEKESVEIKSVQDQVKSLQKEPSSRVEGDKGLGDRINKLQSEINNLNEAIEMMLPTLTDFPEKSSLPFPIPIPGQRTLSDKIREKLQKK